MKITFKKNGADIIENNWESLWKPKKQEHWKDGRSSKEFAKFAFKSIDSFHDLISKVLKSCGIEEQDFECEPEATSSLGTGFKSGGCRNHDLLMVGNKNCIIGIEAKVDESFDKELGEERKSQKKDEKDDNKTRADKLCEYFEVDIKNVNKIGYQLFTGTRGTINSAINNKKEKCIFLVIVFDGDIEFDNDHLKRIEKNNEDFKCFCNAVDASYKPFHDVKEDIDCWIKKVTVTITKDASETSCYSFNL